VSVRVKQFEGTDEGEVIVAAAWYLNDTSRATLVESNSLHRMPGWTPGDYPDLVRKLDEGLSRLAAEIGEAVRAQ